MTLYSAPRVVVVDASVAIGTVTDVDDWPSRMAALVEAGVMLLAPTGLPLEVANGLLIGQRLATAVVRNHLRHLAGLEIELSDLSAERITECSDLAARHGLTVYDAAYLHLAMELDAELATRDRVLARAARAEGIVVHE